MIHLLIYSISKNLKQLICQFDDLVSQKDKSIQTIHNYTIIIIISSKMAQAEEIAEQLAPLPPSSSTYQSPSATHSPQTILHNAIQHLHNYYITSKTYLHQLNNWDQRTARCLTDFKREYILSIGNLMNRSVCMAVGGGMVYRLLVWNSPSVLRRSRNLLMCYVMSGWLFVPQLFNPFLPNTYR